MGFDTGYVAPRLDCRRVEKLEQEPRLPAGSDRDPTLQAWAGLDDAPVEAGCVEEIPPAPRIDDPSWIRPHRRGATAHEANPLTYLT